MKKLLILMLVLGMSSFASAALTDVFSVVDTTAGSPYDALDTVNLKVVLNAGYEIDGYKLGLTASSAGTAAGDFFTVGTNVVSQIAGGSFESDSVTTSAVDATDLNLLGIWAGAADVMWDFGITVTTADGENLTITLASTGTGSRYRTTGGDWITYGGGETLDTIDLATTPEPITIALLGLGGLFLRRRK